LLSVKPGITGLWQVTGRSSTTFDDMVRLDLKYINEWSLGLDIKILFMTPWVILTGKGAY
jgi:lipopolysaccharide/colanic/teichoic acid biosynthesis glycosyltransferase